MTRKFNSIESRNSWIQSNQDNWTIIRVYDSECTTEDGVVYFLPAVDVEFNWTK